MTPQVGEKFRAWVLEPSFESRWAVQPGVSYMVSLCLHFLI